MRIGQFFSIVCSAARRVKLGMWLQSVPGSDLVGLCDPSRWLTSPIQACPCIIWSQAASLFDGRQRRSDRYGGCGLRCQCSNLRCAPELSPSARSSRFFPSWLHPFCEDAALSDNSLCHTLCVIPPCHAPVPVSLCRHTSCHTFVIAPSPVLCPRFFGLDFSATCHTNRVDGHGSLAEFHAVRATRNNKPNTSSLRTPGK